MTNFLYAIIILQSGLIVGLVIRIQAHRSAEREYNGYIADAHARIESMRSEADRAIDASRQVS